MSLLDVAAQLACYGQREIGGEESSLTFDGDLYVQIGCGLADLSGCSERDLRSLAEDLRCGKNGVGDRVERYLRVCRLFRRKIKLPNRLLVSFEIGLK